MRRVKGKTRILLLLLTLLRGFQTLDTDADLQDLGHSEPSSTNINDKTAATQSDSANPTPADSNTTTEAIASSAAGPTFATTIAPSDGEMCGNNPNLPQNSSGECEPDSDNPCCNQNGENATCGHSSPYCTCDGCIDYRVVQSLRNSEGNCEIARVGDFLKKVCSDADDKTEYHFKCVNSHESYELFTKNTRKGIKVSNVCDNDINAYQACLYRSRISYNYDTGSALCGGYHCVDKENKTQFIPCDKSCTVNKECPTDGLESEPHTTCNHKCDKKDCRDESECNNYNYGVTCEVEGERQYVPVSWICFGNSTCEDGEDERDCNLTNSNTTLHITSKHTQRQLKP